LIRCDDRCDSTDTSQNLGGVTLVAMLIENVANFVSNDRCELIIGIDKLKQACVDPDFSARHRKGIR
tara:strand:- start:831 stop:1031 length:201 start_codon:yes stop_codon:yes gene_type:complete